MVVYSIDGFKYKVSDGALIKVPCGRSHIPKTKKCTKGKAQETPKERLASFANKERERKGMRGRDEVNRERVKPRTKKEEEQVQQNVRRLNLQPRKALPPAGQSSAPEHMKNSEPLPLKDLQAAVMKAMGYSSIRELRKNYFFKLNLDGDESKLKSPDFWEHLYREVVGTLPNERFMTGRNSINGVDVTKVFRPWQAFNIDPNSPKYTVPKGLKGKEKKAIAQEKKRLRDEDVKAAYRRIAKHFHPDHGGSPEASSRLKNYKESLLA